MIVPHMEQIDPNDLLVFARVVAEGSFTAAADKLGLPKSTVSRRLSQLEEQLGERLLLRTTRRLSITEFGSRPAGPCPPGGERGRRRSRRSPRAARRGPSGRLRVSMPSDFANLLLTDMLAAFAALHPAVTLGARPVAAPGGPARRELRPRDPPRASCPTTRCSPHAGWRSFPGGCTPRPRIWPSTASRRRRTTSTAIARYACSRAPATRSAGPCCAASSAGRACRQARSPRTRPSC